MLLLGRKIGMTRVFDEAGNSIPVTAIRLGPCVVTQIRTPERDGYAAVQVGFEDIMARRSTIPLIAHDAKAGTSPKRVHREFRVDEKDLGNFEVGQTLGVDAFNGQVFVDVTGTSKGKGFAGTMKRHHFKGQLASHGVERKHRSPGSIGGHATNRGWSGKLKKGKKMAGQLGNERVTMRSIEVVRLIPEDNLMLVKGAVPGANTGLLSVKPAVRLYKGKAARQANAASAE